MSDAASWQAAEAQRWPAQRAWDWYNALPWLVGCNYIPSNAINQLEMWQAETFDPAINDRELGWLAALGMNSMRVFLHDLPWMHDAPGFLSRLEQFLDIAHRHRIGIMFVFFDSVWHPFPHLGKQRAPEPGVHNSGWVQSPGRVALEIENEWPRLEDYVRGVVRHFRNDPRVQVWDIWNEPDNDNGATYGPRDLPYEEKSNRVLELMAKAFAWARAEQPSHPLTSGVWRGYDWHDNDNLPPLPKFQLRASDVISFHRYDPLPATKATVELLQHDHGRPLLCTEYLARGHGSTFPDILPYFAQQKVAAYNWGAVAGKTQTIHDWPTWQKPDRTEPVPWHHDILRTDGEPFDAAETKLIRSLTKA
ncbi:MAG TPA: hypothetical protein VHY09_08850 [Candidatus Methylacidiphilales bacterium]|jgi:hypothetical protein|nr:hypothetical protein [Candidatus Methylacidiphilales bacterium]